MNNEKLLRAAINAANNAYAPYSCYKVGAALLTENNTIYTGCNIENVSFSATNCAERTAFYKAVSEGERSFNKIAIAAIKDGKIDRNVSPCGICRQVMSEFCSDDFIILTAKSETEYNVYTLSELLPNMFSKNNLNY